MTNWPGFNDKWEEHKIRDIPTKPTMLKTVLLKITAPFAIIDSWHC